MNYNTAYVDSEHLSAESHVDTGYVNMENSRHFSVEIILCFLC